MQIIIIYIIFMPRKTNRRIQREQFIALGRLILSRKYNYPMSVYRQTHLNTLQFAYSIIIHGLSYMSTALCFLENNIIPPCHTSFYSHLDIIIDKIIEIAYECVFYEKSLMGLNTIISMDGSWDHRRRGKNCIVVIIDQMRKKIIDFEVIRKSTKSYPTDYHGSSQNMETEAVKRISKRLKSDYRIIGYVHDKDSSVSAFMRRNWPLPEFLDRNHSVKCLSSRFYIVENICGKQNKLFIHLFNFMNFLISLPCTPTQKVNYWLNAADHYCGKHKHCIKHRESQFTWEYAKSSTAVKALKTFFIKNFIYIITMCSTFFDPIKRML